MSSGENCSCRTSCDLPYLYLRRSIAPVAQLVEQLTLNQRVQGSSPCRGTFTFINPHSTIITFATSGLRFALARETQAGRGTGESFFPHDCVMWTAVSFADRRPLAQSK